MEDKGFIIKADNKNKKATLIGIAVVVLYFIIGIFVISLGNQMLEKIPWWAPDSERAVPLSIEAFGGFLIIAAIMCFTIPTMEWKFSKLELYEDHIEGCTIKNESFHEKVENISSVSVSLNKRLIINMKNGRNLICLAVNANEVATAIRQFIK